MGIIMFKDVLSRLRSKKTTEIVVDKETLWIIYRLLYNVRLDAIEVFQRIKNRKLKEVYDNLSFMMIKIDKIIQFLRRILNDDLYIKYLKLSSQELENYIIKLPTDVALTIRRLIQMLKLLKEFASTAPPPYINSIVKSVSSIIDDIAKHIDRFVD